MGVRHYNASQHSDNKPGKIGLLVASGTIVDGHKPEGTIGSESLLEQLRDVKQNKDIKALVIRIDSGGGSAFASEIIRNEIMAVRAEGIPVLISMGSVAASGGYWIATAGDEIWAMPTTITGSIGVFGVLPTFENSLQKIGINTDGISTTELGGALSLERSLSPKVASIIQSSVDHTYQSFIKLVAESRKKELAEIDAIAQGHVWTGNKALEIGLVDHLGNLNEVIAAAAKRAEISNYSVKLLQQKLSPKEEFIRALAGKNVQGLIPKSLLSPYAELSVLKQFSPILKPLLELQNMNDPQKVYASCLDCITP